MFCSKCGNPINENEKFCANCGTAVEVETAEAQPVAVETEPVAEVETVVVAQPEEVPAAEPVIVAEVPAVETVAEPIAEPQPKKRMSKKAKICIVSIAAAVVALFATGTFVFWDYVENFFKESFSSDEEYYQYVENKNVENISESIGSVIGSLNSSEANGGSGEITIKVGDLLLDYIAENAGVEKSDIAWAKEFGVKGDFNIKDDKQQGNLNLLINNKSVLSAEIVIDYKDMAVYMRSPEVNEKYLLVDISGIVDSDELNTVYAGMSDIMKVIPDEETVTKIIERYLTVAIESLDDVTKETVTVKANGVEQKCTELTVSVDENDVKDIIVALMKELKKDKDIKKIYFDVMESLPEEAVAELDMSAEELYDSFIEEIDKAIDSADEAELDEFSFEVITWVDSKGEAIGREVKIDGMDDFELFFLSAHDGKDVGIEAVFMFDGMGVELLGKGKINGSKMNGKIDATIYGVDDDSGEPMEMKALSIDIKNYDVDLIEDNYVNGIFTVTLTDDFVDYIAEFADLGTELSDTLKKSAIKLEVTSSEGKGSITVSYLYDNELVIGLTIGGKETSVSKITVPGDAVSVTDENAAQEYLSSIDPDAIIQKFVDAGIPRDLIDSAVDAIEDMMTGGDAYYDDEFEYDGYDDPNSFGASEYVDDEMFY